MELKPKPNNWNWVEVALIQALVGQISTNMLRIGLKYSEKEWVIRVWLEQDDEEDREAISETISYLDNYLTGVEELEAEADLPIRAEFYIGPEEIYPDNTYSDRTIFLWRLDAKPEG
jgi:hypothetical protein